MILHLIINDFAKIKNADIALSDLNIFVGSNNSGKTMMMQLIYGLRKQLWDYQVTKDSVKQSELNGQLLIRCDGAWFQALESNLNQYVTANKDQLIRNIFGTSIPAGNIRFRLEADETEYYVCGVTKEIVMSTSHAQTAINMDVRYYKNARAVRSLTSTIWADHDTEGITEAVTSVWRDILCKNMLSEQGQLFMPAARSGIQLLYRYYFANANESNLVMPVRDFLQFLQVYTMSGNLETSRRDLIEFGESQLLDGQIQQKGDDTFYLDNQIKQPIPLYIASSMVHEVTPLVKALSAYREIDCLYCDEIENSLHPLLQREMARWIIRMVNTGIQVIVSSHSDTMASALNNLLMLAHKSYHENIQDILFELEFQEADMLRQGLTVGVYEFKGNGPDGTRVERLDFMSNPMIGYDFQLFADNLDKLYEEADKITR